MHRLTITISIGAVFSALAFSWFAASEIATLKTRLDSHEKVKAHSDVGKQISTLSERMGRVETSLEWMRTRLKWSKNLEDNGVLPTGD